LTMSDFVKKALAFGMGAAMYSAEKMKTFADEMVARGEMTTDEAGKFVDDMSKRAEDEKQNLQEWIREQMSKMLQQMGAAEAARVEALEARLAILEAKFGVQSTPTVTATMSETVEVEDEEAPGCP
jgi:polyhydroxyalkanoate synthesis regulator phasin